MRPTAAQLRAARAWLRLSRETVAHLSGICRETLARAEQGHPATTITTLEALVAAYALKGIAFGGAWSVERRSPA